mmetsp:Transcript_23551/g.63591  ORF Transcript_23551/g.63591 Transcript_23551/m.63591 type:complete len:197 (+) Transcript_23551:57-647(+)
MVLHLFIGEACVGSSKGYARRTSTVSALVHDDLTGEVVSCATTSTVQEGHTPMWNEVVQLDSPSAFCCCATVAVAVCDIGLDNKPRSRTYSIDVTIPLGDDSCYCDEWLTLHGPNQGLDECVRVRVACCEQADVVCQLQRGVHPYRFSKTGQPIPLQRVAMSSSAGSTDAARRDEPVASLWVPCIFHGRDVPASLQ